MGKLVGIHRNKTSNPFKAYNSSTDYLVVGGGGGSTNQDPAGGAGAGGLIHRSGLTTLLKGVPLLITIGAGASYGQNNGSNSIFDLDIAYGGGFGSRDSNAGNGGSGGGAAGGTAGLGTAGQGNNGGAYTNAGGASGGGAGQAGSFITGNGTVRGGNGLQISITGVATYYAGGGAGGRGNGATANLGGLGGGGSWKQDGAGQPNTGGGAGGATPSSSGGSGVVIVAYPNTMGQLLIDIGLVYTYSSSSRAGYHVYTFTAGTGYIGFR
jgi:hypothetical protein